MLVFKANQISTRLYYNCIEYILDLIGKEFMRKVKSNVELVHQWMRRRKDGLGGGYAQIEIEKS